MNERIRLLAEQAGLSEGVFTRHNGIPCDLKGYSMLPDEMEKFAQLIVAECLEIAKTREDEFESAGLLNESNAVGNVAYRISRQFGVKR